jgi:hypothetical protein
MFVPLLFFESSAAGLHTIQGSLANQKGNATWQIPLALQCLPALFLFAGICLCNESPRWLARQDNWEKATAVLSRVSK